MVRSMAHYLHGNITARFAQAQGNKDGYLLLYIHMYVPAQNICFSPGAIPVRLVLPSPGTGVKEAIGNGIYLICFGYLSEEAYHIK